MRVGAVGAALVLAGFVGGFLAGRGRTFSANSLPDLGPAPAYALTNQLGLPVASSQFAGKVRLVTFLSPYCTTYCPLITAHLIGFERFLAQAGAQGKVQVVAFNLVPKAAGPAQLRAFLRQYGWDPR
ncbi:MAG: SCO family protein, partial [Caulobacteraceae bacterium]